MAIFYKKPDLQGESLRIDKVGKVNTMPSGWTSNVESILVDDGYYLCIYDLPYIKTSAGVKPYCIGPGVYNLSQIMMKGIQTGGRWGFKHFFRKIGHGIKKAGNTVGHGVKKGVSAVGHVVHHHKSKPQDMSWNHRVNSFHLRKDCDSKRWTWDNDCKYGDKDRTIGDCNNKTSQCFRNRQIYCNTANNDNSNCLTFCGSNHGVCDTMMQAHCKLASAKDSDLCSCINSPATKYNPLCIDSRCTRAGYATYTMTNEPCPSIVDCSVYNDIKGVGGNVNFTDAKIEQRCGAPSSSSKAKDDTSTSTPTPTSTPTSTSTPISTHSEILKYIISTLILLMILSGVIFLVIKYIFPKIKFRPAIKNPV